MDDEDSQQFCLRWHHHQSSLTNALGSMLWSGVLADVTLSAGGKTIKAHRLVLASCSEYFAQLFKELSTESGSIVVVLGCSAVELRLLLTFMYTGEVTCTRSGLPQLLKLAHSLRVEGLTDANANLPDMPLTELDDETHDSDSNQTTRPHSTQMTPEPPELQRSPCTPMRTDSFRIDDPPTNYTTLMKDFSSTEALAELIHKKEKSSDRISKLDQIVQQLYSTHKDVQIPVLPISPASQQCVNAESADPSRSVQIERKWRLHTGGAVCAVCNKRLSNQYNLRVHLETHAGTRHACHACSHVSRSRDALRKHVAYRHPGGGGVKAHRTM